MKHNSKLIVIGVFVLLQLYSNFTFADVPKPMLDNVYSLSEAAAVIDVCMKSSYYRPRYER
jgi:hypothetical protein